MKLVLILGGIGIALFVVIKMARAGGGKFYVDGQGNLRNPDGSLREGAAPPNPIPGDPRLAQSGGWNLKSLCQKAYGTNGHLISEVPDKHAQYVSKANNVLGDINCGALGYAEKAVGAVIVTPAKKLWNAIF